MSISVDPSLSTARLFGDRLDPEAITALLATTPYRAAPKGGNLRPLTAAPWRPPVVAKTGTWFITTQGRPIGMRPVDHLAWVLRLMRPVITKIRHTMPEIELDFSLLVHDPEFQLGDIPAEVVEDALSMGRLWIECPANGKDWLLTADTWHPPPAKALSRAGAHD